MENKQEIIKKINIAKKLVVAMQQLLELMFKRNEMIPANEHLYNVALGSIGKDMAQEHNELGCMEAVNNIVQMATGRAIGGGASTYLGYEALIKSSRFAQVRNYKKGDIIISPSGWGDRSKVRNGHIGIMGENGVIMSNRSEDGLWMDHWNVDKWNNVYRDYGRYPVKFYRLKQ